VRKKADPAALRTLGLFTGKTVLEEAETILEEEAKVSKTGDPRDMVNAAEETAMRWLGLDAFHEGDDIKLAVHAKGHAVLVLVNTSRGQPYGTITLKLTKTQWSKLKQLAREGD
jgi:hypothetical protein